jgi:nitroreductase
MSHEFEALNAVLDGRYSCRAFRNKPVAIEDINAIIQTAQKVPSWCNFQPWQVHLVTGDVRDRLSEQVMAAAIVNDGEPDVSFPETSTGKHKERRRTCGLQLYQAVGVARGDREGSRQQMLENYRFFGAPQAVVVTTPKELGAYGVLDCGAFVTAFMMAAQAKGIATIAQASIAEMSEIVRDTLGIPRNRDVLCAISFGYEDADHPANQFRTERASLDEVLFVPDS